MPKAAKAKYIRDSKTIQSLSMKRLASKVQIGGSVGSYSLYKLCNREYEMNKKIHEEARAERAAIRAKKHGTCNLCGGWKQQGFKICGKCHRLKATNATK